MVIDRAGRDLAGGQPTEGGRVQRTRRKQYSATISDVEGQWASLDVPPEAYKLRALRDGYASMRERGLTVAPQAIEVDVVLRPAEERTLHVEEPGGAAYVGSLALHGLPSGVGDPGFATVKADAQRRAICGRIVPGKYELRVTRVDATGSAVNPRECARVAPHVHSGENAASVRPE